MQRYNDYARLLATGAPAPSATVDVFDVGTVNPASIFSDNLSPPTAAANPLTADANGFFFFYAANGRYDVRLSAGGIPVAYTWGDILLEDNIFARTARAARHAYLGGSLQTGVTPAIGVTIDVLDPMEFEIDGTNFSGTAEVEVFGRVAAAPQTLTPVLFNVTTSLNVATGTAITAIVNTFGTFSFTPVTGVNRYRLRMLPGISTTQIFLLGAVRLYET